MTTRPRGPGECPFCKSKTIKRKGRYGYFYGCSHFPECRGTRAPTLADEQAFEEEQREVDEDRIALANARASEASWASKSTGTLGAAQGVALLKALIAVYEMVMEHHEDEYPPNWKLLELEEAKEVLGYDPEIHEPPF